MKAFSPVRLLSRLGCLHDRGGHKGSHKQCSRRGNRGQEDIRVLPFRGNPDHRPRHANSHSRRALANIPQIYTEPVRQGVGRSRKQSEAVRLSQTSSRTQETTTKTNLRSPASPCFYSEDHCRQKEGWVVTLKGLVHIFNRPIFKQDSPYRNDSSSQVMGRLRLIRALAPFLQFGETWYHQIH